MEEDRPPWEMDPNALLVKEHERRLAAATPQHGKVDYKTTRKKSIRVSEDLRTPSEFEEDNLEKFETLVHTPTKTKYRLEQFAREYIKDFSILKAYIRLGKTQDNARANAHNWFWHPYTQVYLTHLIRSIEEHTIVGRNEVLAGLLKEANNHGPDASSATRIMAWTTIGKFLGMAIQKVDLNLGSSGVMRTSYGTGNVVDVEAWESQASKSQLQLKNDVRN